MDDNDALMRALSGLANCEKLTRHDPHGFTTYKAKVKETLEILLPRLERNHLYEKYLQTEIDHCDNEIPINALFHEVQGVKLEEIRDEDIPSLPNDEKVDTADSVEFINRHTVSQLQDMVHELRLREYAQSQQYEARIDLLERQLTAREAEIVELTLKKKKEAELVGVVIASLRKKIDAIGYNIALRANLPFPPPNVLQRPLNGNKEEADPPSPLQQYLGGSFQNQQYAAQQRDHILSQFDKDEEESFYECDDYDDDYSARREAGLRNNSNDEDDGESVDLRNQLLERYDSEMLSDDELNQLEANDTSILAGETGAGEVVVGYEELDGMESEEERDPLGDSLGEVEEK